MRPNRLNEIKQKQIEEFPDIYCSAEAPVPGIVIDGNLLSNLKTALQVDLARIKTAKTLSEKARIKAELLPAYLPFVDDYVEQHHDYPCDVVMQAMIWMFDTGDIESALALGLHLVAGGNQVMPPRFDRDLPTFISDAMYDWASEQLKNEQTASPYLDELVSTVSVDKWDLHPAVISKNLVMLAKHRFREGEFMQCVELCEKAETVNPEGAGVKTLKAKAAAKVTPETE